MNQTPESYAEYLYMLYVSTSGETEEHLLKVANDLTKEHPEKREFYKKVLLNLKKIINKEKSTK